MSTLPKEHTFALVRSDEADRAMARGDIDGATRLFAEAAALEEGVLWGIPPAKLRTIGILGVSAAALWYEATDYKKAIAVAEKLLEIDNLDPYHKAELKDILAAVPYETSYTGTGPAIYTGIAAGPRDPSRQRLTSQLVNLLAAARSSDEELSRLYEEHRTLLHYVGARKFSVPDEAVDTLINEVFLTYMQTGTRIEDVRAWFVAAMCNACRHYWRAQARTEELAERFDRSFDPTEALHAHITLEEIFATLPASCRELLERYYSHGLTLLEIAQSDGVTVAAAHNRLKKCVDRARKAYASLLKKQ